MEFLSFRRIASLLSSSSSLLLFSSEAEGGRQR
jgi:hypothetical protein